ncbi:MAG: vanadium-dependent haloperoxidase, partial [Acidobacteria bacterium]|nr:vanadium-dependent haloperoxidase [Acidobacteriota bacterium]
MRHTTATISHSDSVIDGRKKRTPGIFLVARILLTVCLVISLSQGGQAQDVVIDWNGHAANAIVGVAQQPPPRGMIRLAMVHVAIYDAVNAIEGHPFTPYAVTPNVVSPASPEAAAAAAAHDVLIALFPNQQTTLDANYAASLAAIPDGPAKTNGISVGQQAAAGILSFRANDGRDLVVPYTPGVGPGVWNPTPPGFVPAQAPEVAHVQPFTLKSPSQFRAEPPPDLSSETWVRDYDETKSLGRATDSTRTPEQTDLARFISDQPVLQWNRAWRGISVAKGLSLADNARFFAMLTTASSDALIACWDTKFFYNRWRPVTAIRAGDTDGNPETEPDPDWIGLVITPPHPEYPAAHGCFSGASAETLEFFFGTDKFDFTMDSKVAGLT